MIIEFYNFYFCLQMNFKNQFCCLSVSHTLLQRCKWTSNLLYIVVSKIISYIFWMNFPKRYVNLRFFEKFSNFNFFEKSKLWIFDKVQIWQQFQFRNWNSQCTKKIASSFRKINPHVWFGHVMYFTYDLRNTNKFHLVMIFEKHIICIWGWS